MQNLIIKPIKQNLESPIGFLLRAAEVNGWKGIDDFLSGNRALDKCKSKQMIACRDEHWSALLNVIGYGNKATRAPYKAESQARINRNSFVDFNGIRIKKKDLRFSNTSICSHCLEEDGYTQSCWDHRSINICVKHKVNLIQKCNECGKKISWKRKQLATCDCGAKFQSGNPQSISTEYAQFIIDIFAKKDAILLTKFTTLIDDITEFYRFNGFSFNDAKMSEMAHLSNLNKIEFQAIIEEKVVELVNSNQVHPRMSLMPLLNSNEDVLNNISLSILTNTAPPTLYCDEYDFRRSLTRKEVSSALGISIALVKQLVDQKIIHLDDTSSKKILQFQSKPINRLLIKLSKGSGFIDQPISLKVMMVSNAYKGNFIETIEQIVFENKSFQAMKLTKGMLDIRVEEITHRSDPDLLSISEVAELCHVHYENIRFAVHAGILKQTDAQHKKGTTILINEFEARAFNRKYIFAGALAKKHNLNHTNISEKIMYLGIVPVSGPNIDGGLTYLFKRFDLLNIDYDELANMTEYETKTGRKRKDFKKRKDVMSLPIQEASDKLNISLSKTNSLVSKGLLEVAKNTNRGVRITLESFEPMLHKLHSDNLIEISEAYEITGESKLAFYKRWVQTQFIELIDIQIKKFITKADLAKIQNFKSLYITTEEAGKLSNSDRSYLQNLNKLQKIKPAKVLTKANHKINFYSRSEVMELVSNNEF